jgi:putative restriction endonuclease
MSAPDIDSRVRLAAFEFLAAQTALRGEVLPREILAQGFDLEGARVPLVGPQGIFKPALLPEMPLTITTVPEVAGRTRPYADSMGSDGLLRYSYRGTDPLHRDNVGLRTAMQRRVPLAYFFGVVKGEYMPVWPVYIVGDDPARLEFSVAVDEPSAIGGEQPQIGITAEARRAYLTIVARRRLHQQTFRQRVLRAYRERCAVCRLRRHELLEAAHILPDVHPLGEPVVPNGVALCSFHHAAFDRNVLGIRSDLIVELRLDILRETDGPMLIHGLQGFQGRVIEVPREGHLQPNPVWLAERYQIFRRAS